MPVTIHHNIAPISPSEELRDPHYFPEILTEFEEFPNTTFIWSHAIGSIRSRGCSVRNIPS